MLLTRLTVVVSVHLGVRALLQELDRLCARGHLGATRPSVAFELLFDGLDALRNREHCPIDDFVTRRVNTVTNETERTEEENCERRSRWTVLVTGRNLALLVTRCSSGRTRHALRTFSTVRSAPHFK